jgi:hypothetical protein
MVVAETRGLLRPLKSGDHMGRIREHVIFSQLQRETKAKAVELRFIRESMAAQYVPGDTEMVAFTHHREVSYKQYIEWLSQVQPYMDWARQLEDLEHDAWAKDVTAWEDEFGSLNDPEVIAENERLTQWLKHGGDTNEDEYQEW